MVRHHAPPALVTLWHPLDHHGQAIGSYQRELQTGDGVVPNAHNHALNQNQPNKEDKCLWSMHGRFGTVSNFWLIWRKPHDPVQPSKQNMTTSKHAQHARTRYQKQKTHKHEPIHQWSSILYHQPGSLRPCKYRKVGVAISCVKFKTLAAITGWSRILQDDEGHSIPCTVLHLVSPSAKLLHGD